MNSELFVTLPPRTLFFRCAVPAMITSVFGALYSVEDGIVVGRFLGEDALASVNLIMPVIMIVQALSNMIATGASVKIPMFLGQHKQQEASRVFSFSIKIILLFSAVISALGYIFARPFITLISPGASREAVHLSTDYLRVYSLFGPLIPIYFVTDNYLRVCGKEKLSMVINISTQIINIILDIIFIVILRYGIKAAAVSSCISIAGGSIVTLALFCNKRMDVYYTNENIPPAQFFHIAANGASGFFNNIAASFMSIVMKLFLLKYGGTTAVAAFSVVMYVDSIIGMMNFGIVDSLQPAISYCYGAGFFHRMKAIIKIVIIAAITSSSAVFLFMLHAGPHIAAVFIKPEDTHLLAMSVTAIKLFSFSYLVGWIDMCCSSLFTALDFPGRSMITALFGTLVFPIIFLFILTGIWGLHGIWLMPSASAITSGILTMFLAGTMKLDQNRVS